MQVEKVCKVCGKEFSVVKSRAETAVTCSRECRGKIDADRYKQARIKRACLVCGKEFEVIASKAEKAGKYCSHSCHNVAMVDQEHKTWADGNEISHTNGYVLVRDVAHPFSVGGYIFQHRIAMENLMRENAPDHKFLIDVDGLRYLRREIQVHHIDEEKTNNKPMNLIACTAGAHRDIHDGRPVLVGEIFPDYDWIPKREYRGVKRACENCGVEFFTTPSSIKDGRGKNCSAKCSGQQRSKKGSTTVICQCCGKEFITWASHIERGSGKFCSSTCRYKARKGHAKDYVFPPPAVKT